MSEREDELDRPRSRKKQDADEGAKKESRREYPSGNVTVGAMAKAYGNWVRGAQVAADQLGLPTIPEELIAGVMEPACQRLIDYFIPGTMLQDAINVGAGGFNAFNVNRAFKKAIEMGGEVIEVDVMTPEGPKKVKRIRLPRPAPDGAAPGGAGAEREDPRIHVVPKAGAGAT